MQHFRFYIGIILHNLEEFLSAICFLCEKAFLFIISPFFVNLIKRICFFLAKQLD